MKNGDNNMHYINRELFDRLRKIMKLLRLRRDKKKRFAFYCELND